MDYSATFTICSNAEQLYLCMLPEIGTISRDRSSTQLSLDMKKEKLTITVNAKDVTSFRASVASVMNAIVIYERTKAITQP